MRIAVVDYGLKRIGLAISDERAIVALPLKMVASGKSLQESARIVMGALKPYAPQLEMILVGLPLLLKGHRGEMAEIVERFVEALRKETEIPISFIDERLSSAQADRALKEMGHNRKERTKIVDSTAACLLLQAYLEQKR